MDKLIEPGKWDRECLQRAERDYICVCVCVCMYKYGSERACSCVCVCVCVRALYVDGWCTGLEGKRSRLLSLRTCQSSAERNQKESKSQHWARVYVCVHVFVCVWNAFSHLAIPKNKWGGKRVRMGDGCGAAWRHTALQWFSAASPPQTTQTRVVVVEADFAEHNMKPFSFTLKDRGWKDMQNVFLKHEARAYSKQYRGGGCVNKAFHNVQWDCALQSPDRK